jgi:hypothetical protein
MRHGHKWKIILIYILDKCELGFDCPGQDPSSSICDDDDEMGYIKSEMCPWMTLHHGVSFQMIVSTSATVKASVLTILGRLKGRTGGQYRWHVKEITCEKQARDREF